MTTHAQFYISKTLFEKVEILLYIPKTVNNYCTTNIIEHDGTTHFFFFFYDFKTLLQSNSLGIFSKIKSQFPFLKNVVNFVFREAPPYKFLSSNIFPPVRSSKVMLLCAVPAKLTIFGSSRMLQVILKVFVMAFL